MLKKILLLILLVIVIGLTAAYFYRNMLVEAAVEKSGTYVLKVDTNLGSASLDLGGGSLSLSDYTIDNPAGFEGDHFLKLDHAMVAVNSGSLLDDEVVIDSIVLEGFRLSLEQIDRKGNYLTLLDNLKKFNVSSDSESSKKLKVKKVALRDIGADLSLSLMGKVSEKKSFVLDDFTLKDVGGADGTTTSGLIKTVIGELLTRVGKSGPLKGLDLDSQVDKLKDEGTKKIEETAKDKLKGLGL